MRKTLLIDDKEMEFEANAGTAVLYKRAFGTDLLKITQGADDVESIDAIQKLAFIMNIQTEGKTSQMLKNATEEKFFDWICQFSTEAFWKADIIQSIVELWVNQQKTSSASKN